VKKVLVCLAATLLLASCDVRYAMLGFPLPVPKLAKALPIELEYREAKGGLVVLRGRVNGKSDVDFILDTGAPVSVLIDGTRTAGLGLDSSKARPLGNPDNPGTPVGDIQGGFHVTFGDLALAELTAVVIPQKTMPCQDRFEEIGFGGVIGAALFKQFVVEVDTIAKRVRLHDPKTWKPPAGATVLPLAFRSGHPFVQTRLTLGDGQVIEAPMNVDIGMNRPLTLVTGAHPALVMPADGVPRKSCYVNGVREEREGKSARLHLADAAFEVATPIYSAHPNAVDDKLTSTIGVGLFRGRRIAIDYPASRLAILP
jgi:hypothetical protein